MSRQWPSLRAMAWRGLLVVALAVVLVFGASLAAITELRRATANTLSEMRTLDLTSRIETDALRHYRASNLLVATGVEAYEGVQDEIADGLRSDLRSLVELAQTPAEREAAESAERLMLVYLEQRVALEERGVLLEELVPQVQPRLDDALEAVRGVRTLVVARADAAQARAEWFSRAVLVSGVAAMLLILAAALGGAWVLDRAIVRPVDRMSRAIDGFRGGRYGARLDTGLPEELARVSQDVNGLLSYIAWQRENQLAFLGGVVHDFRNSLSIMQVGMESLTRPKDPPSPEKARRTAEIVERQVRRLNRMVGDLVDATRVEAGQLQLERTRLDLRSVVEESIELFEESTAAHRICFLKPEVELPVLADAGRMAQVVNNLVGNAVKYSPEGGTIQVSLYAQDGNAVLAVSDQGVGMSPEESQDIFQPFHRGRTGAGVAPGTGLGLSVVRRIVTAHGGRVEVESTVGIGSTFRVVLPLIEEAELPSPEGAGSRPPASEDQPPAQG